MASAVAGHRGWRDRAAGGASRLRDAGLSTWRRGRGELRRLLRAPHVRVERLPRDVGLRIAACVVALGFDRSRAPSDDWQGDGGRDRLRHCGLLTGGATGCAGGAAESLSSAANGLWSAPSDGGRALREPIRAPWHALDAKPDATDLMNVVSTRIGAIRRPWRRREQNRCVPMTWLNPRDGRRRPGGTTCWATGKIWRSSGIRPGDRLY